MNYLLDSNTLSDLYNASAPAHPKILQRLSTLTDADKVCFSILSLYEFEYGFANTPESKKVRIRQKIIQVQKDFCCLPLTPQGAELFGLLKKSIKDLRNLNQENLKKHNIDLMMISTAITENCMLVSADKIFTDIQTVFADLSTEDWTA
jgi:predicted nucleic acid-binding protein